MVTSLPAMHETRVRSLNQEDPVGNGITTRPSILAWEISGTEEPGRIVKRSQKRHDLVPEQQQQFSYCKMWMESWPDIQGNPLR